MRYPLAAEICVSQRLPAVSATAPAIMNGRGPTRGRKRGTACEPAKISTAIGKNANPVSIAE